MLKIRMQLPRYENKPFKPPRRIIPSGTVPRPVRSVGGSTASTFGVKRTYAQTAELQPARSNDTSDRSKTDTTRRYFTIMYRKYTTKKNKTWNGDGYAILILDAAIKLIFYNEQGKPLGSSTKVNIDTLFDSIYTTKGLEFQLDYEIFDTDEIRKVRILLGKEPDSNLIPSQTSSSQQNAIDKGISSELPVSQLFTKSTKKFISPTLKTNPNVRPISSMNKQIAKTNRPENIVPTQKFRSLFDCNTIENPLIMNTFQGSEVDIIVDPLLCKMLRNHQRIGVKFMYDCLLGLETNLTAESTDDKSCRLERDSDIKGCILADDMGLGKTLMTITLIWTLLKQTPFASKVQCSQLGVPLSGMISKVVIVCPVTLIGNWKREFKKWLGLNRIGILTLNPKNNVDMDKISVRNFIKVNRTYQVLILGYEKVLTVQEELLKQKDKLDLLICDEGHRLKNGASKILKVLKSLDIDKKVILTGTPIQNDLNEFFTIIDFVNPGVLGTYASFKKLYINPISRARDINNKFNTKVIEQGEEKSNQLIEFTKRFILRRSNNILSKFLPPKTDIILFCRPTIEQIKAFRDIIENVRVDMNNITFNTSLGLINLMKKVCNSPSLLSNDPYYQSNVDSNIFTVSNKSNSSGKLTVLLELLLEIKATSPMEKVVIVSNYTQSLDIIQGLMNSNQLSNCRLDGATPAKQRDMLVNTFNNNPNIFGFLLSAKAGGVGLNLIGASRLVLFDNDWNPAVDLQAMSRIHREGQKRPCYIYRLITTGCIDEKILQRQLMKHNLTRKFLSSNTSDTGSANDDLFDKSDLKDLFTIHQNTKSNTHDLICRCDGLGEEFDDDEEVLKAPALDGSFEQWSNALDAKRKMDVLESQRTQLEKKLLKQCLLDYKHIDPDRSLDLYDDVATEVYKKGKKNITFAFIKVGNVIIE